MVSSISFNGNSLPYLLRPEALEPSSIPLFQLHMWSISNLQAGSYIYPEFNHCFAIFAAIILVQATNLFHPIDSNGLLAGLPASSTSGPTSALLHTAGQSPPTPPISQKNTPNSLFRLSHYVSGLTSTLLLLTLLQPVCCPSIRPAPYASTSVPVHWPLPLPGRLFHPTFPWMAPFPHLRMSGQKSRGHISHSHLIFPFFYFFVALSPSALLHILRVVCFPYCSVNFKGEEIFAPLHCCIPQ